ncbi:hypothetical protein IGB42_01902 [Andreprevotia sp. IGB-42]|uniref:low affinity iron permease family protein n=1 Tax=Andreprevotia sp. IGB-42 TaxID=2497473 RepID=UPI0013587825|nr:low affinity iron permease family protein [Andreprevotia sp. IGB-42]KAF0813551.1 hypothetical protein IGB42_01902 [Andreprevotia sp. IGB-42]
MSATGIWFTQFSRGTSALMGRPVTFALAVTTIVVWAISGPLFHFSDTWQLVINTGTTIITFLMVFLIQNTQNRESAAVQLKLDELINAVKAGNNALIDLEELDDDALALLREKYLNLAREARNQQADNSGQVAGA